MRMLLGLLFCLPLLAQDAEKENRVVEVEIAGESAPADEGARKRIVELARELAAEADDAKRAEMVKELVEALTRNIEANAVVAVNAAPLRLRAATANPFETMNGSWDENGRKGTYTLKSLGGGRYRLEARIEGGDAGPVKTIEEEGSLSDLQRDHPFLRKGGTMFLQFAPDFEGVRAKRLVAADEVRVLGGALVAGPQVGLVVESVPEELAHHLVLVSGEGLLVTQVLPGSRAEKLGLRRYDVLMRLGDERVESPAQLKGLHGETGTLEIIRRGEPMKIELGGERK